MRRTACTLALLLVAFPVISAFADPLTPPEAAALTTRLLDGRVWLAHAVMSASSMGTRWSPTSISAGAPGGTTSISV